MNKLSSKKAKFLISAFTSISHMCDKIYSLNLIEKNFPRKCINKQIELGLLELFLISGILNSPKKLSLAGIGNIFQHAEDFNLKSSEWISTRIFTKTEHKTKLTENLATGICGILLYREYNALSIEDIQPLLVNGSLEYATKSKVRPDFLCLDQNSEAFVVECKGRESKYQTSVLSKAKIQTSNIKSGSVNIRSSCGYMITSTKFDYSNNNNLGDTTVIDPTTPNLSINLTAKQLILHDLNRTLSFFNLPSFDVINSMINRDSNRFAKLEIQGTTYFNLLKRTQRFDWPFFPFEEQYLFENNQPQLLFNVQVFENLKKQDIKFTDMQKYSCTIGNESNFFLNLPNGFGFRI